MIFTPATRIAEALVEWYQRLRGMSRDQVALRVLAGVTGSLAIVLGHLWAVTFFGYLMEWIAIIALICTVALPATVWPMIFSASLAVWWLAEGSGAPLWQAAAVAFLLGAVHIASAVCAAGPSQAPFTPAARRLAWGRIGGFLLISAVAIALVGTVELVPSTYLARGLGWTIAALVIVLPGGYALLHRR